MPPERSDQHPSGRLRGLLLLALFTAGFLLLAGCALYFIIDTFV